MKPYKNCQSCGMPFSKDVEGGGTEKNGNKSVVYCSHCYQNGTFTSPDMTMNEMKEKVKGKLMEFGIPKVFTGFFTRNINKLERWKMPR
ncbi:zinc ribbon domain-containing protein [Paenisporosarcina sp. OV554]|uniref:zinc ribbon domain-containing protein n=1 Tax=Paenisporosarcina sp. OV554 TaxID=2135694 RepID=UPI000D3C177B|nr:zinc ribbon domain-containing protein [Paenisporosarcina sp. OV554]PUB11640.1 putative zinc ribbon protein [Paenisporosarcina sp. OV554]